MNPDKGLRKLIDRRRKLVNEFEIYQNKLNGMLHQLLNKTTLNVPSKCSYLKPALVEIE
jgi:hypothetical protein